MNGSTSTSERKKDILPLPTNSNRCKYNVESITTAIQSKTEDECCPFFVDIPNLPRSQIDHLRQVGLLPRVESPTIIMEEEGEEIIDLTTASLDESDISWERDSNMGNQYDLRRGGDSRNGNVDEWDHEIANLGQRHLHDYNSVQGRSNIQRCESRMSTIASELSTNSSSRDKDTLMDQHQFDICLLRTKHITYCLNALLRPLPSSYFSLDSSRPWMIYWNLHSLDLLDALPEPKALIHILKQLELCWQEFPANSKHGEEEKLLAGGYGGGPGQMAHCANTYAAVLVLCIIAGCNNTAPTNATNSQSSTASQENITYEKAAKLAQSMILSIRPKLYRFFYMLRTKLAVNNTNTHETPVGFSMHLDGESDVRGTYTVIAISHLLHILTPDLVRNVSDYIFACQTYEGGFGGEPMGTEAHGGYTFCAVAGLYILGQLQNIRSVPDLLGWLARRQMEYEGGYSGRSNKLVDGCYSFWIGGSSALMILNGSATSENKIGSFMHDAALERYLLLCGQCVEGGLRDKPSKNRDFYHTCYCLSGLSTAQHYGHTKSSGLSLEDTAIYGHPSNLVQKTDPAVNIRVERVEQIYCFFQEKNIIMSENGFCNYHGVLMKAT